MGSPITWQNIGQANFGDANAFLQTASDQANAAFTNATTRAKTNEQKVVTRNTNALLNKLGSIQDEDTLNAFRSTIDFNDPTIDSNAVNLALMDQGKNILQRKESLTNIAGREQDIQASKANVANDAARLGLEQSNTLFEQDLATERNNRENVASGLSNRLTNLQIGEAENLVKQQEIAKDFDRRSAELMARTLGGELTYGQANAELIKEGVRVGNVGLAVDAGKKLIDQMAASYQLTPEETQNIALANAQIDQALVKANNDLKAVETNFINKEYNGKPPQPPKNIDEQINENQTTSDVLNEFVRDLSAIDENVAEEFVNQSDVLSGKDNMGYSGILKQLSDKNGNLYNKFREEAKKVGIPKPESLVIDPALLKASLKATSPVGQFSDGIDYVELARNMARIQVQRVNYQDYLTKLETKVAPTKEVINRLTENKLGVLTEAEKQFKQAKQDELSRAFGNSNAGSAQMSPTIATDLATQFIGR